MVQDAGSVDVNSKLGCIINTVRTGGSASLYSVGGGGILG